MEQEKPNDSVRPLLMLLEFEATKLVARIILKFIGLPACVPLFLKFLTLGFKICNIALDILSCFLFGIYGYSRALPSTLDV